MTQYYYEKNQKLLDSNVNVTFDDVLKMTTDEFRQWVINLRKTVVDLWDNENLPPRVGYNKKEIIKQFAEMPTFPVHKFLVKDQLTGELDVIRNTSNVGNAVNQWFPTMMKTRINYTKNDDGKSIYDYFAKPELLDTFVTYATRHFKRDSFYHYSLVVKSEDTENTGSLPISSTGKEWIQEFEQTFR